VNILYHVLDPSVFVDKLGKSCLIVKPDSKISDLQAVSECILYLPEFYSSNLMKFIESRLSDNSAITVVQYLALLNNKYPIFKSYFPIVLKNRETIQDSQPLTRQPVYDSYPNKSLRSILSVSSAAELRYVKDLDILKNIAKKYRENVSIPLDN
jgi:hypothetical protein